MKKLLLFLLFAAPLMAQVPSPNFPLSGTIGAGGNFPLLNSGTLAFTSDANRTMVYPEMSASVIRVTSTVSLTATRNLVAPIALGYQFIIQNATTGGQSIQIIGATGTGVTVTNGTSVQVYCDGTNYVQVSGSGGGGAVSSVFGRTGSVTATSGDYTVSQVTGAAPLASPTFTGTVGLPSTTTINSTSVCLSNGTNCSTAVSSFNTRTGAVTPASGDYTVSQVTGAAPLASPGLTGIPTGPTATTGANTTQLANMIALTNATAAIPGLPAAYVSAITTNLPITETSGVLLDTSGSAIPNNCTPGSGSNSITYITGGIASVTSGLAQYCSFPATVSLTDATPTNARTHVIVTNLPPVVNGNIVSNFQILVGGPTNSHGMYAPIASGNFSSRDQNVLSVYSQGLSATTNQSTTGFHCLVTTIGTSADSTVNHMYIDGSETQYGTQTFAAGWTTRAIGDVATLFSAVSKTYGQISNYLAFSVVLPPSAIPQVCNYQIAQALKKNFYIAPTQNYSTNNTQEWTGNSLIKNTPTLTSGQWVPAVQSAAVLSLFPTINNNASGGKTAFNMAADFPVLNQRNFSPNATYNQCIVGISAANDYNVGGGSTASILGWKIQMMQGCKASPWVTDTFVMTEPSSTGLDTQVQALNALTRTYALNNGVHIMDIATDPNLGASLASQQFNGSCPLTGNTFTYWQSIDCLHESVAGAALIASYTSNSALYYAGANASNPFYFSGSGPHTMLPVEARYTVATGTASQAFVLPSCAGYGRDQKFVVYSNTGFPVTISPPAAAATFTGTATASTTITVSSTTGLAIGQMVIGAGVPTGTVIASVGSGVITVNNSVTLASVSLVSTVAPLNNSLSSLTVPNGGKLEFYPNPNLPSTSSGCNWTTGDNSSVASVFGRTGAVVATSGDYSVAQVTGAAPLASPTFTGNASFRHLYGTGTLAALSNAGGSSSATCHSGVTCTDSDGVIDAVYGTSGSQALGTFGTSYSVYPACIAQTLGYPGSQVQMAPTGTGPWTGFDLQLYSGTSTIITGNTVVYSYICHGH